MAIQQLTEVQKRMLNNMCVSAKEVQMGDLLTNIISAVNSGGGGSGFVPVASNEVAGIVKTSTEVVVNAEGVMSVGSIEKHKVKGLVDELSLIEADIQSIKETGVVVTVVERVDTVEENVAQIEKVLTVVEDNQSWGDFS